MVWSAICCPASTSHHPHYQPVHTNQMEIGCISLFFSEVCKQALHCWVSTSIIIYGLKVSFLRRQWFNNLSNQIFRYTCCNTPKRVTSLRAYLHFIAPGEHSWYRRNVATVKLCSIWPVWYLNLRPPASETNRSTSVILQVQRAMELTKKLNRKKGTTKL